MDRAKTQRQQEEQNKRKRRTQAAALRIDNATTAGSVRISAQAASALWMQELWTLTAEQRDCTMWKSAVDDSNCTGIRRGTDQGMFCRPRSLRASPKLHHQEMKTTGACHAPHKYRTWLSLEVSLSLEPNPPAPSVRSDERPPPNPVSPPVFPTADDRECKSDPAQDVDQ